MAKVEPLWGAAMHLAVSAEKPAPSRDRCKATTREGAELADENVCDDPEVETVNLATWAEPVADLSTG